ncbi:13402_t:CDS:2 [Cetraspora pellucida]|uniref:13402_t:CDS:1 n=1 Tax=Cetraspora pellucida TaxID=1433469 RepID=A0A9N9HSB4_9GLOM|nr:13402_t:CDS:2 [Cetraspora pellucida]
MDLINSQLKKCFNYIDLLQYKTFEVISVSNDDSNLKDLILSEEDVTKFKAKVIIELDKLNPILAKWFTFKLDNFGIFQDSIVKHIQICINDNNFDKVDI